MHDREHVPRTMVHLPHEQMQVLFGVFALGDVANQTHEPAPPAKVPQLTLRLQPTYGPIRSLASQFDAEWRAGFEREAQRLFDFLPVLRMDDGKRLVVRHRNSALQPVQDQRSIRRKELSALTGNFPNTGAIGIKCDLKASLVLGQRIVRLLLRVDIDDHRSGANDLAILVLIRQRGNLSPKWIAALVASKQKFFPWPNPFAAQRPSRGIVRTPKSLFAGFKAFPQSLSDPVSRGCDFGHEHSEHLVRDDWFAMQVDE